MADDFDLAALADYLHLDLAKVTRLAERGKLPGRRVGGDWRFSQAEIHHWLEERIGDSNAGELLRLEAALERAAGNTATAFTITDLLPPEAIAVPLAARTRASVMSSMVDLAAGTGWLWDPEKMAAAVRQREELHPTTVDGGVALLHPRRPLALHGDRAVHLGFVVHVLHQQVLPQIFQGLSWCFIASTGHAWVGTTEHLVQQRRFIRR